MKNQIKGVLPHDYFHATIVQTNLEDDTLNLYWKVDQGKYAYRTLVSSFQLNNFGLGKIYDMCEKLNIVPYPHGHEEFVDQFYGLRGKLYVDIQIRGNYKVNVILDYELPDSPQDFNVLKEKTDDHFYHTKKKRSLPL